MHKTILSIIGQCYNEQEMLPVYYREMCKVMDRIQATDFELIFVDDCSTDKSLEIIEELAEKDARVKCLSMSRNFGKAACCIAGLEYASGDYIVTMDIDLQDPPELLTEMMKCIEEDDVDIVATIATTRKGYSAFHKLCTKWFYKIFNSLSSVQILDGQRDYRLMTRQVVNAIIRHKEYNLFDKGYFTDVGFHTKWITFENVERPAGQTKWPFKRLLKFSLSGIIGYSVLPLKAISVVGVVEMGIAAALLLLMLVLFALGVNAAYVSMLIAAGILGLFGIQMTALGVLSAYVSQIHTEVKARPRYIVRRMINLTDQNEIRR